MRRIQNGRFIEGNIYCGRYGLTEMEATHRKYLDYVFTRQRAKNQLFYFSSSGKFKEGVFTHCVLLRSRKGNSQLTLADENKWVGLLTIFIL